MIFGAIPCLLLSVSLVTAAENDAQITIDAGDPGIRMSPQLWGIFFEEINFAGDGGIYAELVRNRAFEERRNPLSGWSVYKEDAECAITIDRDVRLNTIRKHALRVDVKSVDAGGGFGIVNSGYWGVPVKKGDTYSFSLFVKADNAFAGARLRVSLRDKKLEKMYAEKMLAPLTTKWQEITCTLVPDATDFDGRLALAAGGKKSGTFWINLASLFPPTWKNQPNGLRADLVQLLADLKPSFFRFPGGCFAEGRTLQDTFLFKETVGSIEKRKGRPCFWGYRSTDGLGYYEYLRLAEDLGADPIFCINPGGNNGCSQVVPMAEMEPWFQTAVDAVEFAIGSPESTWGAKRAAMGHPKPFHFSTFYLQIGNETEFSYEAYTERFRKYRARVKAAFPEDNVKIIADSWGMKHRQTVDTFAIDYHRYMSWRDAINGRDQYDNLPRGKPYVFKGEYATRSGSGILQALSEAVYMMGLEENSDEVVFASYAPLFANVNGTQWRPDLIYFDNHRSMGTISYWVQQMFSAHRGTRLLPVKVEEIRQKEKKAKPPAGSIGIGSWDTEVMYKDIRVVSNGKTVFTADTSDADKWKTLNGRWEFTPDGIHQKAREIDCRAWIPGKSWSSYKLQLKAKKIRGAEGFLIMVHVKDGMEYVWANLGGWGNSRHAFERATGGAKSQSSGQNGRIERGRWYDITVDVDGNDVACFVDGRRVLKTDLGKLDGEVTNNIYANACTGETPDALLVRVVNIAEEPKTVTLSLREAGTLKSAGEAVTLHAASRDAKQSLEAPLRYSPRKTRINGVAARFTYTFKPCSFTILKLKREE